ncbi:hypothetical protein [Spirillospora sp. CA-294931]|uniref:hypothetical protein n=1 Tax=Spirillospora sp. CA-294931 TaxID=3240042 RepID=UPI003D8CD217
MTTTMRDHPGWDLIGGVWRRAAAADADHAEPVLLDDPADAELLHLGALPATVPAGLRDALEQLGPVRRWRNPSLWDALATAIIRQVVRADQARIQHRRFRETFGPRADGAGASAVHALPAPATVAALSTEQFRGVGLAFKADALRAAATAYLDQHAAWAALSAAELVQALQAVPRVGPWTAGAAVADHRHDWSLYPYDDLAVRTWARTAAPQETWPDSARPFAERWRRIAGAQLGPITLFTLAWGAHHVHTSTARPPDPHPGQPPETGRDRRG